MDGAQLLNNQILGVRIDIKNVLCDINFQLGITIDEKYLKFSSL